MAIVGLSRNNYTEESVTEAVNLAGGIKVSGESVLVKPAVNDDKPSPANVNHELVGQVVNICVNSGAENVVVSDRSNYNYKTLEAMKKTGIFHAIMDNGGRIIDFDDGPWTRLYADEAKEWSDGIEAPSFINDIDKIVNVCCCKTHRLAGFSGAMLNLIGLTSSKDRMSHLHRNHEEPVFSERIAELSLFFKSDFTVMDATSVFLDEGPESGDFAHPGIVIASDNPVAADIIGIALLKSLGVKNSLSTVNVWQQPQIRRALKLGIGPKSPDDIEIKGDIPELANIIKLVQDHAEAA